MINRGRGVSIGWGLWLILAFGVLQAIAAVYALLLDAGWSPRRNRGPSTTRTRSMASTAQYGQQYGNRAAAVYGQPARSSATEAHASSRTQEHARSSPPDMGRSTAVIRRATLRRRRASLASHARRPRRRSRVRRHDRPGGLGAQSGPQPAAQQQGTSTPPTGFPSFGSPPSTGATDSSIQAGARRPTARNSSSRRPAGAGLTARSRVVGHVRQE